MEGLTSFEMERYNVLLAGLPAFFEFPFEVMQIILKHNSSHFMLPSMPFYESSLNTTSDLFTDRQLVKCL